MTKYRNLERRIVSLEEQFVRLSRIRFSYSTTRPSVGDSNVTCNYGPAPEPKPEYEIPAGWEVFEGHYIGPVYARGDDYGWWSYISMSNLFDAGQVFIRQKFNLDLSKQPEELKYWAMDKDGAWTGFSGMPSKGDFSWCRNDGFSGRLFKSQFPTNYTGSWEDSLIERPENYNA